MIILGPPALINSAGMLSSPGDLLDFNFFNAYSTSDRKGGGSVTMPSWGGGRGEFEADGESISFSPYSFHLSMILSGLVSVAP